MANSPPLQTSGLPSQMPAEAAATTSPARGQEMRNFLQSRLLQKHRAPPLVHSWDFWHDRQDRHHSTPVATDGGAGNNPAARPNANYEARLEVLANVDDVRKFWNVFNNFDNTRLQLRDSIHLFHKGVKPVWEDPRNARGGSWTFRVPKTQAVEFWKEICMMAIGEQLQQAVESDRTSFRDDICGVSLAVRFNSMLVQVWNRDGEHADGIDRILKVVLDALNEELRPREGSYYYKKHSEHAGFSVPPKSQASTTSTPAAAIPAPREVDGNGAVQGDGMLSLNAIVDGKGVS